VELSSDQILLHVVNYRPCVLVYFSFYPAGILSSVQQWSLVWHSTMHVESLPGYLNERICCTHCFMLERMIAYLYLPGEKSN
jgi:hypothetical protein